jgi:tRNA(adenine34) deaminase
MALALCEARKALREGEVPVGAVIVKDGELLSKAYNRTGKHPLYHAELLAMMEVSPEELEGATLYVTMEPCVMCSGAVVLGKLKEVIFAVENPRFGGTYSLYQIPLDSRLVHRVKVRKVPPSIEVVSLLRRFFGR